VAEKTAYRTGARQTSRSGAIRNRARNRIPGFKIRKNWTKVTNLGPSGSPSLTDYLCPVSGAQTVFQAGLGESGRRVEKMETTHDSWRIETYPLCLRVTPIIATVLCVFVTTTALYIGSGIVLQQQWRTLSPVILILQCASVTLLWIPFAVLLLAVARSTWFYLYSYRIDNSTIEAIGPFFGKPISIDFARVSKISAFIIFGEHRFTSARVGHLLEGEHGLHIKVSEALPCWEWIQDQCRVASFEPRPAPWWEITE
jgi:hypothetical protein